MSVESCWLTCINIYHALFSFLNVHFNSVFCFISETDLLSLYSLKFDPDNVEKSNF